MSFFNANDSHFYYGDTCNGFNQTLVDKKTINSERKKFKIPVTKKSSNCARIDTSKVRLSSAGNLHCKIPQIRIPYEEDWGRKLRWLDDFLNLEQKKVAKILDVSESTVQKIVSGKIKDPQKGTKERIRQFISIAEFVNEKTNKRTFQARKLFFSPLTAIGNKSVVDYLLTSKSKYSLNDIDGLMRRILE